MESNKLLDLNKYKKETIMSVTSKSSSVTPKQAMKTLDKEMLINAVDGKHNTIKMWFSLLNDGEGEMVHCPISPEKHANNDANASCSMRRNGDYLNLKCFGCGGKQSLYLGQKSKDSSGKGEFTYSVPSFEKESAIKDLTRGMNTMTEIVSELVRLLPALEKKEKKDD